MDADIKEHEKRVLELLALPHIGRDVLDRFVAGAETAEYDATGYGYYLTIRNPGVDVGHVTIHEPLVIGTADGISTGWLLYLDHDRIMIECHGWGEKVPKFYRERIVGISSSDQGRSP
jgi:hypothetical protein